jgi:ATP-binding cassette subfamily B protein
MQPTVAPPEEEAFTLQEYFTPTERRRLRRFPQLVRLAVGIVWRAAPRELVVCALLQLVVGIALAAQLLVMRTLLAKLIQHGTPTFGSVVPELIGLAAVGMVVAGAGATLAVRQRVLGQLVALYATDGVVRTATGVDLITYDSPGFHDRLQRAQLSAQSRPALMVEGLLGSVGSLFAVAGVIVALIVIQPLFCLLVLVAYIPTWLATNRAGRLVYRYSVEQTERERLRMYLFDLLTTKQPAQEVRAFDVGEFLAGRQRAIYAGLIEDLRVVLNRRLRISLTGQALTALLASGALGVLVWFVTSGRMSLADAGSAAAAMILLTGQLRGVAGNASGLYESSLYLEDYSSFVAAAPKIHAARPTRSAQGDFEVLRADAVSFTYPSRDRPALSEASLELRRGEVVALVGENGSGKTTFAKLLGGLFTPSAGAIRWGDVDLRTLDPVSVRERIAVIFQDFVRYQLSVHDNIAMGDHRRFDDLAAVERAARAAGIHETVTSMRRGYDSLLGPSYYGGSDLSGGQWQRIGLARAFFKDAPIVILDEPTASLDPRAEAELYASMRELFAGRGVLLISHRFGSVRTADRIYVMRDGRVHESGSHQDLIAADGYYAELFRMQASMYAG